MCNPLLFVMAASAAVSAAGSIKQGRDAKATANRQAAEDEYQGEIAHDNANAEATRIRRSGEYARGETLGALAASGVKVGEGSALIAEQQVMEDYETDASIAMLNGRRARASANATAANTRKAGRNAQSAANINAGTTLLSTGAQGYRSGWGMKAGG